jgi:hypothetical protein
MSPATIKSTKTVTENLDENKYLAEHVSRSHEETGAWENSPSSVLTDPFGINYGSRMTITRRY